jgi:hypothetical protein
MSEELAHGAGPAMYVQRNKEAPSRTTVVVEKQQVLHILSVCLQP